MSDEEPVGAVPVGEPVPVLVWWLTFVFAVVGVAAVFWAIPHEEDDLRARSEQAIDAAGFTSVQVEFAGRDASLSGSVETRDGVAAVERVVAGLEGVRAVDAMDVAVAAEAGGSDG